MAEESAAALCGRTRGLDLDHGQPSTNYGSSLQDRCSEAAHSAEEYPHHDLRILFLVRRAGQRARLTPVPRPDLEVHLLGTLVLAVDLWAGSCWALDLVGHLVHYSLVDIRRQSWKVSGTVVEICRADICYCPDTDW